MSAAEHSHHNSNSFFRQVWTLISGRGVVIAKSQPDFADETEYLMSTKANRESMARSIAQAEASEKSEQHAA